MRHLVRQVQFAVTRCITRALKLVGLRDRVVSWRLTWRRRRRLAAEERGDDHLSRPALHGLDVKLGAIIDKDHGFFIEAGAHDGFTQSNTYWLEHFRAWRGLLVEPIPEMAAEARLARPGAVVMECALVAADDRREHVAMEFGDLFSMVSGAKDTSWPSGGTVLGWRDRHQVDVRARTLSSLLDEIDAPEVDLLSLDTEGYEASVLRGLDFSRHAPRYLLVEIHDREKDRPPVDQVLASLYVEYGWLSPVDVLFVRRDIATFDGHPVVG